MHTNKSSAVKKPFPWRCSNCLERAVREAVVDYVATRVYDGVECTVNVAGLSAPKCEKCGQVAPDSESLAAIEHAFDLERQRQADTRRSA